MMMEFNIITWVILITVNLLNQVCVGNDDINRRLEHHINKRSLRQDGFTDFQTAEVELLYDNGGGAKRSFKTSRDFRDAMRFEQNPEPEAITLSIVGENVNFQITLSHAESVLHKDVHVSVTKGDRTSNVPVGRSRCLLSGKVGGGKTNHAVISYCDGLTGWITIGTDMYSVETIHEGNGIETVAIAKGTKNNFIDDDMPGDVTRSNLMRQHGNRDLETSRRKRQTNTNQPIVIETAIILDEAYINELKERGYTTEEEWTNFMTLKWMGVQFEWGKIDELQYNVTISIMDIKFMETNEDWHRADPTDINVALGFCAAVNNRGLWTNYDHIHLFSTSSYATKGIAHQSGVCKGGKKCAVSTGANALDYVTPAHELGHNMWMDHDLVQGCEADAGLMGYKDLSGWSICSKYNLMDMVTSGGASCLINSITVTNPEPIIDISTDYPGMFYTNDKICAMMYGDGHRYRMFPGDLVETCGSFSCINMDQTSVEYGLTQTQTRPIPGRYCGDDKICTWDKSGGEYQCLDYAGAEKIEGGWTDWTAETTCSRSCGTGVIYTHRTCTNLEPKNTAGCEGDEVASIELCNKEPCPGDSSIESELIKQRAGETCSHWLTHTLYEKIKKDSSHYLSTGDVYSNLDFGQCEVHCDKIEGKNAAGNAERHGLMPDGTPCTPLSLSSDDAEVYKLPRSSGMQGRCVLGYCYLLDCTNVTGDLRRDGCGECGGDNSTCEPVTGVYTTNLANGATEILQIPSSAERIQFHFKYSDMAKYYIELVMKDDPTVKVISLATISTLDNPMSYAGTYWYFDRSKQYLHATGPTTHAVHIQIFNNGDNYNQGIHYGYSLPLPSERSLCTGTCENGGTWDQHLCSCICASGFYGISCSDTCKKYCKNLQPLSTSACKCACGGRTYGTTCNCQYPFTGPDCQDCKITECQNGGTFNADQCRCTCPPGYGGLDCSGPCEDTNGDTVLCLENKAKGWCSIRNEKMEAECYMTCGLCEPGSTTTSTSTISPTTKTTTTKATTTKATTTEATTSTTKSPTTTTKSPTTTTTKATTTTTEGTTRTTKATTTTTDGTTQTTKETTTATKGTTTKATTTKATTTTTSGTTPKTSTKATTTTKGTTTTTKATTPTTTTGSSPTTTGTGSSTSTVEPTTRSPKNGSENEQELPVGITSGGSSTTYNAFFFIVWYLTYRLSMFLSYTGPNNWISSGP